MEVAAIGFSPIIQGAFALWIPTHGYNLPVMSNTRAEAAEVLRLREDASRTKNWKRWGPYLAERQWGTVREDYSADGDAWNYFPHDHARSRAYRWGEDGLLGVTDRECRLCFSIALWNGKDPILKERLFGLTGPEGNHGEDVKEEYFYLDSTPTHSYLKALYKYPQAEFPYQQLVDENRRRSRKDPEFELLDTGVFADDRYFDVQAEYAKGSPNDLLIKITVTNRGPDSAELYLLPQLFYRNTWAWGCKHEGCDVKPRMQLLAPGTKNYATVQCDHVTLGRFFFFAEPFGGEGVVELLFTENETNVAKIFGAVNYYSNVRDAFDDYLVRRRADAVNVAGVGTKVAAYHGLEIAAGASVTLRLRLSSADEIPAQPFGQEFERIFKQRIGEADEFYAAKLSPNLSADETLVARQAYAGLFWSKQFYHYIVKDWLEGDPDMPPPPMERWNGRNSDWLHLFNRDVTSMPDKWEYPWYAAWDLAFHMVCFATVDPQFAKDQLLLLLREWYMHPSGQLPAYEFNFSDVNPPVHAWAVWRVYKMSGPRGQRDLDFLERAFHKLLINFTWWVNRKDPQGKNIFSGGFLGMDNVGVFDRNTILPDGAQLAQADGTAWMAFYCGTMLSMALELASARNVYEDVASKFFEHFIAIVDAINSLGGSGLWDDEDGFYYDRLIVDGQCTVMKLRSMVGLVPLLACEVLEDERIDKLPGFKKRMNWFLEHRQDLARHITYLESDGVKPGRRLLAVPSRDKLLRVLGVMLDENEFLSPHGVRSMSAIHRDRPFSAHIDGKTFEAHYAPGESDTDLFGGNSNWRGPVWFPVNFLIAEALEKYHHYYGDALTVKMPTGSAQPMTLKGVSLDLSRRLVSLFLKDPKTGARPYQGDHPPPWRDLLLFHEFFHGDTGKGLGASHQTGWTALVVRLMENLACARTASDDLISPAQPRRLQSV
ncbi:MAG: hypothetical protein QOE14_2457 [Humisphaera sp.]|nr:hypothetical protein [Humisphaera sp.]